MSDSGQPLVTWDLSQGVAVARLRYSPRRQFEEYEHISRELAAIADTEGVSAIVLNLAELDYVSSRFLGILVGLHRELAREGGKLAVCRMRPEPLSAFRLSRLDRGIAVFASEEEARTAFGESRSD